MQSHRQCFHISVARYTASSPLWEVCAFWEGGKPEHDHAATFGREELARAYAEKLQRVLDNRAKRFFKTH